RFLLPKVGRETGFSSVSETHSASGSPVMIGISIPPPGSSIRGDKDWTTDRDPDSCQIVWERVFGSSSTPVVPRFTSIAIIDKSYRPIGHKKNRLSVSKTVRLGIVEI